MDSLEHLCIGEIASVLYRQYQAYMIRETRAYGLGFTENSFLTKIPDDIPITQKAIADKLYCDTAIATRSLQKLEIKGLVQRAPSNEDKRAIAVSLTPQGRQIKHICLQARKQWKQRITGEMRPEDKAQLMAFLQDMTHHALSVTAQEEEL